MHDTTFHPPTTVHGSTGSRIAGLIRRYPLASFFAWFFTVGQAIAFIPVVAASRHDVDLPTEPFIIAATFVGLLLPTLLITAVVDGTEGLRTLWRRVVRVGVPARWYFLALIGVPLAAIAVTAAFTGPPEDVTGAALGSAVGYGLAVQLLVVFVTVNWWEEVAWMGFVQARLQERHGALRAALVGGAVFALGHVSLVVGDSTSAVVLMALLIAVSIPFRALQAWVYNRTDSLFLVGLVHAAANATAVGSVLGSGLLPRVYGEEGAGGAVFPALAVLGLLVLAATRARLGRDATR